MKQENKHNKVKIIPLGGLEQIGMNMTAFEYEDSIIVVDCGLAFPSDDMLGIDLVIPDVTYLKNNISKVKGFVITHGHEDHIGALPYVLKDIPAPVYGTKLTIGLIDNKLKEHNMTKTIKRKVVKHGQSINLGCFRIEFVKTNHSIADLPWLFLRRQALFSTRETLKLTTRRYSVSRPIFSGLQSLAKKVCWPLCVTVPMPSGLDLRCLNGRWDGPLIPFLPSIRTTGFLWLPLPRMWTVYSRLSIRLTNTEEK